MHEVTLPMGTPLQPFGRKICLATVRGMMLADVEVVLHPYPASVLGWFCLGYNVSDALGRVPMISGLACHRICARMNK